MFLIRRKPRGLRQCSNVATSAQLRKTMLRSTLIESTALVGSQNTALPKIHDSFTKLLSTVHFLCESCPKIHADFVRFRCESCPFQIIILSAEHAARVRRTSYRCPFFTRPYAPGLFLFMRLMFVIVVCCFLWAFFCLCGCCLLLLFSLALYYFNTVTCPPLRCASIMHARRPLQ